MKEIPLTQNMVAIVDDEDFDWLSQWKWTAHKCKNTFYADRHIILDGKRYSSQMHREIIRLAPYDKRQCDHKNRNGLDNRKENLREATHSINSHNRKRNKNNTSGYRGVMRHGNNWQIAIRVNGTRINGGHFPDKISAAHGYDLMAIKYWGDDAILNFPKVSHEL